MQEGIQPTILIQKEHANHGGGIHGETASNNINKWEIHVRQKGILGASSCIAMRETQC
jgi:hypothetical protein